MAAGREGAYFLQESKQAVGRLAEKTSNRSPTAAIHETIENEADILPEILKHNLPSKIFQPLSDSTLSTGSKWLLHPDESNGVSFVYHNAINPISSYGSLPQATFGPKRYFIYIHTFMRHSIIIFLWVIHLFTKECCSKNM